MSQDPTTPSGAAPGGALSEEQRRLLSSSWPEPTRAVRDEVPAPVQGEGPDAPAPAEAMVTSPVEQADSTVDEPAKRGPGTDVNDAAAAAGDQSAMPSVTVAEDALPEDAAASAAPVAAGRRRRLLLPAVVVLVLAVVAGSLLYQRRDRLPDDAAFRAAGVVVTEDQVARRTEVLRALYGVQVPDGDDALDTFRRDTAKALAVSTVLEVAAREEGVRVGEKTVRDTLDKFIEERYPDQGRAAFVDALAAQGVGEADVLAEVRRQLAGRELFDTVTDDVDVPDADVRAAYDEDPASYALPERRRLRHIVLADQATAQEVVRRLRGGADFGVVAARDSLDASTKDQGGDLSVLSADQLDPAFATVAFKAGQGALFGPVQTSLGWHVGRVDQVLPAAPTTFEQVQVQLKEKLVADQAVQVWRRYLDRRVEDAEIVYADAYRPADTSIGDGAVPSGAPSVTPSSPASPPS